MTETTSAALRRLLALGHLDLAPLGGGHTRERWRALAALARGDVSLGRLAEAHVDAGQILCEAGRTPAPDRLLGVWASEHPRWAVTAEPFGAGFVLRGAKAFCSGAGIIDDALVTVGTDDGVLLLLVPVDGLDAERIDLGGWRTSAMADTATGTVDLDGVEVGHHQVVGGVGWYLDRPGFWHGAVGPAACWAGAALGLVDHAVAHVPTDAHGRAHVGALLAEAWAIEAILDRAGDEVDDLTAGGLAERADAARSRALAVRHLVDTACERIQRSFERALGPRPLVGDPAVIERHAALTLYRRQCHAECDLEALADAQRS